MGKSDTILAVAEEIIKGLQASEKYISSKFFYDDEGSRIFQDIMHMPEYYPTDCEAEIFEMQKEEIGALFCQHCESIDLVELGAGDGKKTRILAKEFLNNNFHFRYIPIDISKGAIDELVSRMQGEIPEMIIEEKIGDYFDIIEDLSLHYPNKKVLMFLGSNLGNYNIDQSIDFLSKLNRAMTKNDLLFLGLDLKKDPKIIRDAYDDPHGYTSEFNLNLLRRFNRELGADFNTENFLHAPYYDPKSGVAKSFLVSKKDQKVHFSEIDETIHFRKWETIYTEMSQKYDEKMIRNLAEASGFELVENFFDSRDYFVNTLWKKI